MYLKYKFFSLHRISFSFRILCMSWSDFSINLSTFFKMFNFDKFLSRSGNLFAMSLIIVISFSRHLRSDSIFIFLFWSIFLSDVKPKGNSTLRFLAILSLLNLFWSLLLADFKSKLLFNLFLSLFSSNVKTKGNPTSRFLAL